MKKVTSLFFGMALMAVQAFAQGNFKFNTESHDFGTVTEGEQATYAFEFQNSGSVPIIISNVQASCGCTTPEWTKEPIPPKGKGIIKASYNSQGRPGAFNKSITVTSNANEGTKMLYIKGVVIPVSAKAATPEEIKESPVLKLEKVAHNFGKVEKNQTVKYKFKVTNTGKGELKISNVQAGCYCVAFVSSQESFKAGESGTLEIAYTARNPGQVSDIATISSNDVTKESPKLTLSANVVESLAPSNIVKEEKQANPFK